MDNIIEKISDIQIENYYKPLDNDKTKDTPANLKFCLYDEVNDIIYKINIPDEKLQGITMITITNIEDMKKIPKMSGCYWIITNAPIKHCFNKGNKTPEPILENHYILYNGVANSLQNRAEEHLLRHAENSGFGTISGISVDIICKNIKGSHAKCVWSNKKKKLPKILHILPNKTTKNTYKSISNKKDIIENLYLSPSEKEYISNQNHEEIYFKNGINISNDKHKSYKWIFGYLEESNNVLRTYIETQWRIHYGIPILCSYSCGR
jgi:hypothetical protein